jgi:hypothetical protein
MVSTPFKSLLNIFIIPPFIFYAAKIFLISLNNLSLQHVKKPIASLVLNILKAFFFPSSTIYS